MPIVLNGTTGITTPNVSTDTSTLGPLTQALNLGSTGQIVFPATQNPSSNANTLDDYEEGTWTPVDSSGASLSFSLAVGVYTKIGKLVVIQGAVTYPSTANGSTAKIGGMPFAPASGLMNRMGFIARSTETTAKYCFPDEVSTYTEIFDSAANRITNATMSGDGISFTLIFQVA